jgi:SAM-dependent methyltransferase
LLNQRRRIAHGMTTDKIINQWSQSAPYWEKHRETIRKMFAPVTAALVEDANIRSGQNVLDIATGPGEPALSLAELVAPAGSIWAIDPVPEMIAAANRAAQSRGFNNIYFEVAFADRLPFRSDTFDAAVSRFGAMFFSSPFEAVREVVSVLKPAGRLAMAVWHFAESNPFHNVVSRVLDRYAPSAPSPPDFPDAFRFASPGKLLELVSQAGAVQSSERVLQFRIDAPLSPEDFWPLRREMSDKFRSTFAKLSERQQKGVRDQVIENLGAYSTGHGMSFPAEVLIVSGRKK